MKTWRVVQACSDIFILNNEIGKPGTQIESKNEEDVFRLTEMMNILSVPIALIRGLRLIEFKRTLNNHGYYRIEDRTIRISNDITTLSILPDIFVHEVAHHVDYMKGVTKIFNFTEERKEAGKYLYEKYSAKSNIEYLARGFELYYCGNVAEKYFLRMKNPLLFEAISSINEEYRKQS